MKKLLLFILCPFFLFGQTQIGQDINGQFVANNSPKTVSLSLDGGIVAIGYEEYHGEYEESGVVRIYENSTGTWKQIGEDINGEAAFDHSGHSVSLNSDGSIVAIGAIGNNDNGINSGHIRIYKNIEGIWSQIGEDINGEVEDDESGSSISLSADGNIIAIGAEDNDGNGINSGHVRIYKNIEGVWTQLGQDIDGEAAYDYSGKSLNLNTDGSILAIGAGGNDGNGNGSGHVRIYKNINGVWSQIGQDINGNAAYARFGIAVSLNTDGSIVAIGATDTHGNGAYSGSVSIYKNMGGVWTQIGSDINGSPDDISGSAVSLSSDGNIVAIGAPYSDLNGYNSGHVRIYKNIEGVWNKIGQDIYGESIEDLFGSSLSLSTDGKIVAIGAKNNSKKSILSGSVSIYKNISGVWTQLGEDINDGNLTGNNLGSSVSLSSDGSIMAIGIKNGNGNGFSSGYVQIYKNIEGVWSQIGENINGEATADVSGSSISLSADGNIIAIGAEDNDGNGINSGHVRIYKNIEGVWTQLGQDIDGEAAYDRSGNSVSLNTEGSIIAIGAKSNTGNGNGSGHVRIYKYIEGVWVQQGQDIDGESSGDASGYSVSLNTDGNIIAIGARRSEVNGKLLGHVRIYKNTAGVWAQIGQDIDGEAAFDFSGYSVSLNANGDIVAIGARTNDGNGSDSGHARVYKNKAGVWTKMGQDIDGEAAGDNSGSPVSINAKGNVVAIGAIYNNGNGIKAGHVRIYQDINSDWQLISEINGEAAGDNLGTAISLSSDGSIVAISAPFNDGNVFNAGHVRVYDISKTLTIKNYESEVFTIYPNPASKQIIIQLENSKLKSVNIFNSLGQFIKSSKELTIDTYNLSKGIYYLQIETDKGKASKKLVIE